MKFYWASNNSLAGNFGDVINPKLLDYFKIPYQFVGNPKADFDAMCIGSIARFAKKGTFVLGSGFMSSNHNPNIEANYMFVRGPITRNIILKAGGTCPEIYGDPALLVPLFCDESKKEYDIGIIPHVVHYKEIKDKFDKSFVINLNTDNALNVVKEITKCRSIISSSLHGLIVANSYGIPAAWVDFGPLKGDGMKFLEYFMSVGVEVPTKSTIDNPIFYKSNYDFVTIKKIFEDFSYRLKN